MQATEAQDALRTSNRVRLVNDAEEGTGVNALSSGVYGFTYSPGLPSAPLFAVRRYRSFEIHKRHDGQTVIVGFATADDAGRIESNVEDVTIRIQPQPDARHGHPAQCLAARVQLARRHH